MQIVKTTRVTCIREAERIKFTKRPRQDLVKVIERLLAWPECTPLGLGEAGSRMAQAWEGDDTAIFGADTVPALSFEWRTCHSSRMWRAARAGARPLGLQVSLAPVNRADAGRCRRSREQFSHPLPAPPGFPERGSRVSSGGAGRAENI